MDSILDRAKEFEHLTVAKDPLYDRLVEAIAIVKKFIIDHGLILYGGSGMDYALRLKGDRIYPDSSLAIPDLDFYSPTNVEHAYELADILYQAGFENVRAINAMYVRTMRVDVEGGHYIADITFCPKAVFSTLPTLKYNGMKVIHPNFQRIDLHSSLSYPYDNPPKEVIFDRWAKDIKRFNILDKHYPVEVDRAVDPIEMRPISINMDKLRHYPLAGFAAFGAIYHHFLSLLEQLKLEAPQLEPEPRPIEITENSATFNTFDRTVEIVHFDLNQAAAELELSDKRVFEPHINIMPSKMTGRAMLGGELPANVIVYSTANKLVTVNVLDFAGVKIKVVNVQYLLRHFIAMSHISSGRLRATYNRHYLHLLSMISWVEEKISEKAFGVLSSNLRETLMKSPLFPSTYVYGRDNKSLSYIVAIERLKSELGDKVSQDIMTLPWNYYPAKSIARGMPHPVFDYEANEMFRESGAEIKPRVVGGGGGCDKPSDKFESPPPKTDSIPMAFRDVIEHNSRNIGKEYLEAFKEGVKGGDYKPKVLVDDINRKIKYRPDAECVRASVHVGQLKLFLSEIQFLTMVYNEYGTKYRYIVYAGAAPSNHTYELLEYFPDFRFILVDPNRFEIFGSHGWTTVDGRSKHVNHNIEPIKDVIYLSCQIETKAEVANLKSDEYVKFIKDNSDKYRIFIAQEYFTDELAQLFKELKPMFISDIRTNITDHAESALPHDTDLIWNLAQQYNWIKQMEPMMSCLKFRHPFYDSKRGLLIEDFVRKDLVLAKKLGIDFEANYHKRQLVYLAGKIYLQAFAPKGSTETRLIIKGHEKLQEYGGPEDYENRLFYYNNLERPFLLHSNPYIDEKIGFDYCGDCSLAAHILQCYSDSVRRINVRKAFNKILHMLGRRIRDKFHGELYPHRLGVLGNKLNYIISEAKKGNIIHK